MRICRTFTTIMAYIGVFVFPVPWRIDDSTCSNTVNGMTRKMSVE
jgi:hypothetical protein